MPDLAPLLGYGVLLYAFFWIARSFYRVLYPYAIGAPIDLHRKAGAKWAVVTGATDGIGKEYARQLAQKNFNIVLISRTQSRLDETKAEILKLNAKIEVRTIRFDFTNSTLAEYEPLLSELRTIEIGILVNNVGICVEYPDILHLVEGGNALLRDIAVANTLPPTLLSSTVVEQMSARRSGIIVNIASSAALAELSHWSVYSSSKKYHAHFSNIVRREYEDKDIIVQTVLPLMVDTKMLLIKGPLSVNVETFVRHAIRSIGLASETTGCAMHQIQKELTDLVPTPIADAILAKVNAKTKADVLKRRKGGK